MQLPWRSSRTIISQQPSQFPFRRAISNLTKSFKCHSCITLAVSEPAECALGISIYVPHQRDLYIPFCHTLFSVGLIDADGINPEVPVLIWQSEMAQSIITIRCDQKLLAIERTWHVSFRGAPNVGESLIAVLL